MDYNQDQLFEIHYSMLSEPGDALAGIIHKSIGARKAILDATSNKAARDWPALLASIGAQEYLPAISETIERFQLRIRNLDPERAIAKQIELGGQVVILGNDPGLASIYSSLGPHAPLVLWILGDISHALTPAISIVGTREASRGGVAITHRIVGALTKYSIVSGGAKGIDTAAHQAALAFGNPTIAYMAGGLLNLYPKQNLELFAQIANKGLIISESSPEVAPTKWRFLQRNRLIAAHGKATVVVEAAQRSGARNTAGHAFGCGKDVFAFAGPNSSEKHRGCNLLIRDGIAKPIHQVEELVLELSGKTEVSLGLKSLETRALDSLSSYPRSLERICLDSGLSKSDALQALRNLSTNHLAFNTPRGWVSC